MGNTRSGRVDFADHDADALVEYPDRDVAEVDPPDPVLDKLEAYPLADHRLADE